MTRVEIQFLIIEALQKFNEITYYYEDTKHLF